MKEFSGFIHKKDELTFEDDMKLSEVLKIERKTYDDLADRDNCKGYTPAALDKHYEHKGFNHCLDLLDEYRFDEDALAKMLHRANYLAYSPRAKERCESFWGDACDATRTRYRNVAKSIIQNADKFIIKKESK